MRISDWSSDVCSSDLRYLQGRSRQGTRLPKHPYLHLHDLSDRCTARRHPQIHVKRRGAEIILFLDGVVNIYPGLVAPPQRRVRKPRLARATKKVLASRDRKSVV